MEKSAKTQKSSTHIISDIKQQVKNPDRVSIYLSGKYSFSLHINELLDEKLKVGQELTPERTQQLKKRSSDGKLRFKALNWVMLRPRATRELRDYLRRVIKKPLRDKAGNVKQPTDIPSADFIDGLVEDFVKRGYVDDYRYAEWWLGRRSSQKKSRMVLSQELSLKGVSRDIVSSLLAEDDTSALRQLLDKLQSRPRYADRDKLVRYCMSKGFRYSLIVEALAGDGSVVRDRDEFEIDD